MRLIAKTTVATPSEIPWLWMKFHEAAQYVDEIIVSEFDTTLSGLPKPFAFENHVAEFQAAFPQLTYLQGKNLPDLIKNAETTEEHRFNETIFRGWFASQVELRNDDVIVSTDADEVLYSSTYKWIADNFSKRTKGVRFGLHQVFYRPNYLWLDKAFVAPVALRYGAYSKTYPNNWRNQGAKIKGFWGVHFSWCMPLEEMMTKVKSYGHAPEHKHMSKIEMFKEAVETKTFPFDDREFTLIEIAHNSPLLPDSFLKYAHTIPDEVLGTFKVAL